MNFKAVFLDLDGTLLNDDKCLPRINIDALSQASENGVKIIIATGRKYSGISNITEKLPMIDYAITSNGAAIYSVHDNTTIYQNYMSNSLVLKLTDMLDIDNIMFDLFIDGSAYMEEKNVEFLKKLNVSQAIRDFILSNRTIIPSVKQYLKDTGTDVEKITINFKPMNDGSLYLRNKTIDIISSTGLLSCVSGGSGNVEVTLADTTKGNAILHLCRLIDIPVSETVSFGDSENDIHMLQTTGKSVAMENAPDNVKSIASLITTTNNSGGVAHGLKLLKII